MASLYVLPKSVWIAEAVGATVGATVGADIGADIGATVGATVGADLCVCPVRHGYNL